MYDLIIIGMGISGITAGIYAKRAGLKVLILESSTPGGIINNIAKIENYPSLKEISGPDLAYNLFEQINHLNIEYIFEKVTDVIIEEIKTIKTEKNIYHAKNLLIASGRKPKLLGIDYETDYLGRGISTCALCDGALYKGNVVAVVGGGSSALGEALYLSKLVKKVYLIHRRSDFRGEETLINKVKDITNIELILNDEVTDLLVENNEFKGIKLKSGKKLNVSALFEYIGYEPNTEFLINTDIKLENNYIIVDKNQETNIKGVYATGDVTKKEIYQIINAASEGAEAVVNIINKKTS